MQDNSMLTTTSSLENFRKDVYLNFPKRSDAIMNLLDAISSHAHQCNSVVQLSNAECFKRQYSSITDAIADGLCKARWSEIEKLAYQYSQPRQDNKPNCFLVDCTGNPRPFANKLSDRTITHAPNPAPGNKPICVGHQYSVVTMLPTDAAARKKHWLVPINAKRVASHTKGNEVGMEQIKQCIENLELSNELNISVGDSLYGTENCRKIASEQSNLVHIFRLNSTRNLFFSPTEIEDVSKKGRKKEFGDKFTLNNPDTHKPCHQETQLSWTTARGKVYSVTVKLWKDMLLRGSKKFRSSEHPVNLIQVTVTDAKNNPVFKRPLWIGVFGGRRHEITLIDVYEYYKSRYDIEHFFRFGKSKLLLDAYQTADVNHEEAWWKLSLLAYMQLNLSRELVPMLPQPWELYLPEYKTIENQKNKITTPSQTQRGFYKLLNTIGTPARACVPRGKSLGRAIGATVPKRPKQPIVFKSKKTPEDNKNTNNPGSDKPGCSSDPETIEQFLERVQKKFSELNLSPDEFSNMLLNSS
jgi:hypothetical protein